MPKKTFKNNPALQFISFSEEQQEQEGKTIELTPQNEQSIHVPVPMKPNPLYIETRSKRVQLLMQPSLHNKLRSIALDKEISINDLIHKALEEYTNNKFNF